MSFVNENLQIVLPSQSIVYLSVSSGSDVKGVRTVRPGRVSGKQKEREEGGSDLCDPTSVDKCESEWVSEWDRVVGSRTRCPADRNRGGRRQGKTHIEKGTRWIVYWREEKEGLWVLGRLFSTWRSGSVHPWMLSSFHDCSCRFHITYYMERLYGLWRSFLVLTTFKF